MWVLKFSNFTGTIGDRSLKSARSFPQQPSTEEGKGWGCEEGGNESSLHHSCTHPLLFDAISHHSQVFPLKLSMQGEICVTGTGNLSGYIVNLLSKAAC